MAYVASNVEVWNFSADIAISSPGGPFISEPLRIPREQSVYYHQSFQRSVRPRVSPLGVQRIVITRCLLILDPCAFAENRICSYPPVNAPAIVADLKSFSLNRLDEVNILSAIYLAQHNIASDQRRRVFDWFNGAELAGFDSTNHRVPAGAKLNGFALLEFRDVVSRPSHKMCLTCSVITSVITGP